MDIADRAVASLPYLVPLLDGLKYGKLFIVFLVLCHLQLLPCLTTQHCFLLVPVSQHVYPKHTTQGGIVPGAS